MFRSPRRWGSLSSCTWTPCVWGNPWRLGKERWNMVCDLAGMTINVGQTRIKQPFLMVDTDTTHLWWFWGCFFNCFDHISRFSKRNHRQKTFFQFRETCLIYPDLVVTKIPTWFERHRSFWQGKGSCRIQSISFIWQGELNSGIRFQVSFWRKAICGLVRIYAWEGWLWMTFWMGRFILCIQMWSNVCMCE